MGRRHTLAHHKNDGKNQYKSTRQIWNSERRVRRADRQKEPRCLRRVQSLPLRPPHLALPLLVPSEEVPDLIQEPGVLLPAAQSEGGLRGAAGGRHGGAGGREYVGARQAWGSSRSLGERPERRREAGREGAKLA